MYTAPARWAVIPPRSADPALWRGCRFAACLSFGPHDIAGRARARAFGSGGASAPTKAIGPAGLAYAFHPAGNDASVLRYGFPDFTRWETGDLTLFAFARLSSLGVKAGLMLNAAGPSRVSLYTETDDKLYVYISGDGVTSYSLHANTAIADGETFTCAFTQRGTAHAALYLNGAEAGSTATPVALPSNPLGTMEWVLGSAQQGWKDGFNTGWGGLIYTALVWDRALDAGEVRRLSDDPYRMFRPRRRVTSIQVETGASMLADIVAALPPATWYELLGTKLESAYAITDTGDPRYGVSGPKSVPKDWGGGAYDSDNDIFLLHGGGHGAYGGNEVYGLPLDTLAWGHNTPSTYIAAPASSGGNNWTTTDNSPVSVHTYDGLQYIPGSGKLFKYGGARWESGDPGDSYAYLYDTVAKTWERKALSPVDTLQPATAYDASRHCVWVLGRNEVLKYDIALDTWTTQASGLPNRGDHVLAYDPVNDRLFTISFTASPSFAIYNCSGGSGLTGVTITGDVPSTFRVGLTYDSVRAVFVVWSGNRGVIAIDPSTWVATQINAETGPAPSVPSGYQGIYSKWQYLPSYDAFIAYSEADKNAWVYKAGVAGSGPSPGWGDPRRQVALTVAAGKVVGSHTGFNLVITRDNLPDEMFEPGGANAMQVNGGDVRISSDSGGAIRLPTDLRSGLALDSALGAKDGKIELWTRLPSIGPGSIFYVWYSSATTQVQPAAGDPFGADAVWTDLIAGYHGDSVSTLRDVTGGGKDISITSANGTRSGPYASPAVKFDFKTSASSGDIAANQDYTWSFLLSRTGVMAGDKFVGEVSGNGQGGVIVRTDGASTLKLRINDEANIRVDVASAVSFPETVWTLFAVASPVGSGAQVVYKNGALANSSTLVRRAGDGGVLLSGGSSNISWCKLFVRKGVSSPDRVSAEAGNQTSPSTFFVVGSPRTPPVVVEAANGALTAVPSPSLTAALALSESVLTISGPLAVATPASLTAALALSEPALAISGPLAVATPASLTAALALSESVLAVSGLLSADSAPAFSFHAVQGLNPQAAGELVAPSMPSVQGGFLVYTPAAGVFGTLEPPTEAVLRVILDLRGEASGSLVGPESVVVRGRVKLPVDVSAMQLLAEVEVVWSLQTDVQVVF